MRVVVAILVTLSAPAQAQEVAPRPKPIGNPGAWIPAGAYPPGARASGEQGRVAFTLDVDESGHATECKVTATSESPLLDETTCNLMVANGRFDPPRDKKNKPIASKWSSSIRWKLDSATPDAPAAQPTGPAAVAGTPDAPIATSPVKPLSLKPTGK